MAELLASSSASSPPSTTINNENEPIRNTAKSSQDDAILASSSETTTIDSSRVHSKLLHRRIATMLETLRGRGGNGGATSPPTSTRLTPSHLQSKSQPITFGQLRQATTTSSSASPPPPPPPPTVVVEEVSSSKILSARSYTDLMSINKSSPKHQANKERLINSPSLEQLLEQHNVVPRMKEQDEERQQQQQPKPPLTVDEILATYYSKVKVPTTTETNLVPQPSSYLNGNVGFYMHPSPLGWNPPQTNQHQIPSPQLLLNEQNRNRPPPPSYSLSVASGHRPPPISMYNFFSS